MKLLEGKTVLITGGSRGIGKGIVKVLIENGANVAFTYASSSGPALELSEKLNSNETKCISYKSDASIFSDCEKLIENVMNDFGNIDALINNAGITKDNLLIRMKEEDIDSVIQINLLSLIKITKSVLKNMMKQKFGRIISISSVVGFTGNPGQVNYCASKSGITGFTKSLALEVASRGITVNAIAPGYITSAMTDKLSDPQRDSIISNIPVGRIGKPSDISNAVLFLAKEEASYITGNTIHVNGGLAMF